MSSPVILVGGTWAQEGDWFTDGSPFWRYLEKKGFTPICFRGWSGAVGGIPDPLQNGEFSSWQAGGWGLHYLYLQYAGAPIVAHSHGGQVAAFFAAHLGSTIPAIVTVCTPVRKDMHDTYAAARQHVGHWVHVYSKSFDFMQRAGELFDGQVGWSRKMPSAHENVGIPKIGHSGLLNNPKFFPRWEEAGLLNVLRGAEV